MQNKNDRSRSPLENAAGKPKYPRRKEGQYHKDDKDDEDLSAFTQRDLSHDGSGGPGTGSGEKDSKGLSGSMGNVGEGDDVPDFLQSILDKKLKKQQEDLVDICQDTTREICTEVTKELAGRVAKVEKTVDKIQATQEEQGKLLSKMASQMEQLALAPPPGSSGGGGSGAWGRGTSSPTSLPAPQGIDVAPTTGLVTSSSFNRAPDPTVLYINVRNDFKIPKVHISKAIAVLAEEANIDSKDYAIMGQELASKFTIKFLGAYSTSCRRASQLYGSLRLGAGEYKEQKVEDSKKGLHDFFINPDKNGCQTRKEILGKKLKMVLEEIYTDKQFFFRKDSATILCGRKKIVKIEIINEDSTRLSWIHVNRIAMGIEQDDVEIKFKAIKAGDDEQWS